MDPSRYLVVVRGTPASRPVPDDLAPMRGVLFGLAGSAFVWGVLAAGYVIYRYTVG